MKTPQQELSELVKVCQEARNLEREKIVKYLRRQKWSLAADAVEAKLDCEDEG